MALLHIDPEYKACSFPSVYEFDFFGNKMMYSGTVIELILPDDYPTGIY